MIKFLPSYVGSKAYWVNQLEEFKNEHFIEPFCGSAVISASLAKTTILNDIDFYVYMILKEYDNLIVPDVFTDKDYEKFKKKKDWWKYAYCFQKMSFSGVFRYSQKSGYNVPRKKNLTEVYPRKDYLKAKKRYKQLNPIVLNRNYYELPIEYFKNRIVVIDPPYEDSQASYNSNDFDYKLYWSWVKYIKHFAKNIILFDRESNIKKRFKKLKYKTRKMRVNGKYKGDTEVMVVL